MSKHAIEVKDLSKRYLLGEGAHTYITLRETLSALAPWRKRSDVPAKREVWALQDVNFTVDEGESVGVIGRNGAGKTTLLKILARITEPTAGVARTRGRVGALLEVGTGFHPELTGRENLYLNGAVLGMSRRDIGRRFDEIVEFAGVEEFLDTPLKRYSSGMSLRLAFAVAAHLEPEIVVVDEVLAVGDAEFQRKCLGKMSELKGEGRTVLFVSHDLGAVAQLCGRAIWLDNGSVRADGATGQIVDEYLRSIASQSALVEFQPEPDKALQLLSVGVNDESGLPGDTPRRDQPFSLKARFVSRRKIPSLDFGFYILNLDGVHVLDENWSDVRSPTEGAEEPGEYEAHMIVPPVLNAGDYIVFMWIGVSIGYGEYETFVEREVLRFTLSPCQEDRREAIERRRIVQPAVKWRVNSGSSAGTR